MPESVWKVTVFGRAASVFLLVIWLCLAAGVTLTGADGGVIGIIWAASAVVAGGVWRSAFVPYVALTATEVVVQNRLMRSVIPLGDVAAVEPGYYGVTIQRRRGDSVTAWAVQKSNWQRWRHATDTRADEVAVAIRARAEAARSSSR